MIDSELTEEYKKNMMLYFQTQSEFYKKKCDRLVVQNKILGLLKSNVPLFIGNIDTNMLNLTQFWLDINMNGLEPQEAANINVGKTLMQFSKRTNDELDPWNKSRFYVRPDQFNTVWYIHFNKNSVDACLIAKDQYNFYISQRLLLKPYPRREGSNCFYMTQPDESYKKFTISMAQIEGLYGIDKIK